MRDILFEETVEIVDRQSATKKYNLFNFLSIFAYVWCLLWFLFFTFSLDPGAIDFYLFGILPNVIFLVGGILLGKTRDAQYVEFDYRFLTGEVNISKVIKAKKRKNGVEFRCVELEKLGFYNSENYKKYESFPDVKKLVMTSNVLPSDNKDFYYAVFSRNQEKYLVVMECSKQFISLMISCCNISVLDEGLKK